MSDMQISTQVWTKKKTKPTLIWLFASLQTVTVGHCLSLKHICERIFWKCGWIGHRSLQINIWIQVLWFTPMWVCSRVHVCVCVCVCVCQGCLGAVLVGPMPDGLLSGIWWGLVMFYLHSLSAMIHYEWSAPSINETKSESRDVGRTDGRTDTESCVHVVVLRVWFFYLGIPFFISLSPKHTHTHTHTCIHL